MRSKIKLLKKRYNTGLKFIEDPMHVAVDKLSSNEINKKPYRYDIINFLIKNFNREAHYLEIGVRNPKVNFDKINSSHKYSVDPCIELEVVPIDFMMTSDIFFEKLNNNEVLSNEMKFDVIFIDGLHLAEQVERDISNSLKFLKDDGFIVMHDCNPPSEYHASENYSYRLSPAKDYWNGTTWKAFVKSRQSNDYYSCCIDTDWGVGIISKKINLGNPSSTANPFYEFNVLNSNRKESLNLKSFEEFKELILKNDKLIE
jgi:hypothetical protein